MIDPVDIVETAVDATVEVIESAPEIVETVVEGAVEVIGSAPEIAGAADVPGDHRAAFGRRFGFTRNAGGAGHLRLALVAVAIAQRVGGGVAVAI